MENKESESSVTESAIMSESGLHSTPGSTKEPKYEDHGRTS